MRTLICSFYILVGGLFIFSMTAHAYLPAPGVEGRLNSLANATLVCMDTNTRQISKVSGPIGPRKYLGVIGNVDGFSITSVDVLKHIVSIQSDRIDQARNGFCRIDLTEDELAAKTELTGLKGK